MSVTYVSAELRRLVTARAENICEYCLIAEEDTFFGCEVDHVISEKHGGPTEEENLALACALCNQAKGTDLASILWDTGELIRLFNPRTDKWGDHFQLNGAAIDSQTKIGKVTASLLGFNSDERVIERRALIAAHRYPSERALRMIAGRESR